MKSVMNHSFAEVSNVRVPRSTFNRSHGYKTTFDADYLIPIYCDEVLPGDTFNLRMAFFARLATLLNAPMDNLTIDFFFFYCPIRLLWNNAKKFHGEEDNPGDSNDFQIPTISKAGGGHANGSLSDYFGIPTEHHATNTLTHISMFHRMYNLTWNEHFRDQNLQTKVTVDLGDGPDTDANYVLLKRGKRHDYFTSCLPWPQKADDGAVSLPLGTSADIKSGADFDDVMDINNYMAIKDAAGTTRLMAADNSYLYGGSATGGPANFTLYADLTNATAATIDDLILSFQTQALYRRDARAGTRYQELVHSHYGVKPYDLLFRPLYLGGGSSKIHIHPVANTSEDVTNKQGKLAGFGTASGDGIGFVHSFAEHGYVMGLCSVRADITYQEGLDRMFSKQDRFDIYYPALANLGEQSVLNKEIFADGSASDETVFGYQERWAEYRFKQSKITGQFRSNYTSSLDSWHLSQEFATLPSLNSTFIQSSTPIDRIIATPTEPHIIFDSYFNLICARPMPTYSVPSLKAYF